MNTARHHHPHWPSVRDIARELRDLNRHNDEETVVWLQVLENGDYRFHVGRIDVDDQSGYWGIGYLTGEGRVFFSHKLAHELIEQCKDQSHSR